MRAVEIRSNLSLFRSVLISVGTLFCLCFAQASWSSCAWDLSSLPYPEEVLGKLIRDELGIQKIKSGRKYKMVGGIVRERTLVVKSYEQPSREALAAGLMDLARVLLEEKQKQLKWQLNPKAYVDEFERFTEALENEIYPVLGALNPDALPEKKKLFNYATYAARSFLAFTPSARSLWPASQERAVDYLTGEVKPSSVKPRAWFHWSLTRTFAAVYLVSSAMALTHLPEAYTTMEMLYRMRSEIAELDRQFDSETEFDMNKESAALIEKYQAQIDKLQAELANGSAEAPDDVRAKIARFERLIKMLKADLEREVKP